MSHIFTNVKLKGNSRSFYRTAAILGIFPFLFACIQAEVIQPSRRHLHKHKRIADADRQYYSKAYPCRTESHAAWVYLCCAGNQEQPYKNQKIHKKLLIFLWKRRTIFNKYKSLNTSEGNTSEGNTSEGNTSEGKGSVYARRRITKFTLLREKRRRAFMLKKKNGWQCCWRL
jgi:hypothetical protein